MTQLTLASKPCGQCLTTRNRIVPGNRAAQIIRDCKANNIHFICHKSDPNENVHCRGVHDLHQSLAFRVAKALDIPIVEKDMDL